MTLLISQPQTQKISFQVATLNNIPLIELPANIKITEIIALQELFQRVCKNQPLQIVIDFHKTTFIDHNGLELLVSSLKELWKQGIEIVLWSVRQPIMKILMTHGITPLVSIDLETNVCYPTKDIVSTPCNQYQSDPFLLRLKI